MTHRIETETAGTIWKLMVQPGQQVAECETLMIMEVMKMEVPYEAPAAGLVTAVHVTEGEVVEEGVIAVEIG